jgi:DNA-directed RNA polymerase specialized sigma24 family protein
MAISIFNTGSNPPSFPDEKLIQMLKAGGQEMQIALNSMFFAFSDKARYALATHQLNEDTILECYGEALLKTRDSVQNGTFEGKSSLKTFFGKIFLFKCIDKIREATTNRERERDAVETFLLGQDKLDSVDGLLLEEELSREDRLRKDCLDRARATLSPKEQDLLVDSVLNDIKNKDLVEKFGYENNRVVATTLYTLKLKLKKAILDLCQSDPKCSLLCGPTEDD